MLAVAVILCSVVVGAAVAVAINDTIEAWMRRRG